MDHRRPFLGFYSILGLYHLPHLSFPKSCRSEAPSADSFERGEKIHVWSESRQEWLLGHAGAQGSTGEHRGHRSLGIEDLIWRVG